MICVTIVRIWKTLRKYPIRESESSQHQDVSADQDFPPETSTFSPLKLRFSKSQPFLIL